MEVQWKKVVVDGVEYNYLVSNTGQVKSLHRNKNLKQQTNIDGYKTVTLSKDGVAKMFKVHRLVATMFIPNPDNLPVVNHKDETPDNNMVDNLEWCTVKYNTNYGTCVERRKKKITGKPRHDMQKKVICITTGQVFNSIKDAEQWCGTDIRGNLSGSRKSAGKHPETGEKLVWMYYEE